MTLKDVLKCRFLLHTTSADFDGGWSSDRTGCHYSTSYDPQKIYFVTQNDQNIDNSRKRGANRGKVENLLKILQVEGNME